MANATLSADVAQLAKIQRQVEVELARLSRYRLKESAGDSEVAIVHLTKSGVLTRRFAAFLKKILRAKIKPRARVSREVVHDAPEALAVLRIVPNRRT